MPSVIKRYTRDRKPLRYNNINVERKTLLYLGLPIRNKQEINIRVTNFGSETKTFRLFGGDTGLPSVDDNFDVLTSGFIPAGNSTTQVSPNFIAYNADLNYIYTTNNSPLYPAATPSVTVINSETNEPITTIEIPTGVLLGNMAYVSQTQYLYVADLGSNVVFVINTNTNTVVSQITVGSGPTNILYVSSLGKIYVSNQNDNTVSIINASTNLVVSTPTVGTAPTVLAFASSSSKIYVLNTGDGTISVINSSNSVSGLISVGSPVNYYCDIIYVSQTDRLYFTNGTDGVLYVINPLTNTTVTTVTLGNFPYTMSYNPFDNLLYCSNDGDYTISIVNCSSNTVTGTISVTSSNLGINQFIVFNTDDRYLYCTGSFNNLLEVFNTQDSNALVESFTLSIPFGILFNTINTVYVVNNGANNVFYALNSAGVEIVVNGGQTTISELNQKTRFNPVSVEKLKYDTSIQTTINTPINYINSNSLGAVDTRYINLLQKHSAYDSNNVNVVELTKKDFPAELLLDGSHYLQYTILGGQTLNLDLMASQVEATENNDAGPLLYQDKGKSKIKKYSRAQFKVIKTDGNS